MLRPNLIFRISGGHNVIRSIKRSYLSQEFKATMEKKLEIPPVDRSTQKLFQQKERLIPFEIDSFIYRLPENDDRRGDIYEQLLQLRSSEFATLAPETINHAVINYLLSISVEDLLSILSNRLQYGIFIDFFSGCYLMDVFLEQKNFAGAAQVAVELFIQEDFDNDLVQALALKSSFEYVKYFLKNAESSTSTEESAPNEEKADKPVKIRVKYLRNPPEKEMINSKELNLSLIGETISKFSSKCSNSELKQNGYLLSRILTNKLEDAANDLKSNSYNYCKDVIEICLNVVEKLNKVDDKVVENVKESLEKIMAKSIAGKTYSESIDAFIQEAKSKSESKLIEQQKENYAKWIKEREESFNEIVTSQKRSLCAAEIEETVANIQSEKQKLWFFENQDKLDMDIFRKQVHYPKRWFGKKKKPRVIDDNYVPPEIRAK